MYVTGDLVTVREGLLRLTYYNGDKCENGRSSVVFVEFKCDPDVGAVSGWGREGGGKEGGMKGKKERGRGEGHLVQ